MGLYGVIAGILFFATCVGAMAYMVGRGQEKRDRYIEVISGNKPGGAAALKEKNEGAFVPFVAIGDPNPEQSLAI